MPVRPALVITFRASLGCAGRPCQQLITTLHDGQKVNVKLANVADYQHERRGHETAGGYSLEVMRKRGLLPAGADR